MGWTKLADGLWRAEYVTGMKVEANTYAVRGADGGLVIVSPPSEPTDALFAETDALGRVVALVANNSGHDVGQLAWQAHYPDAVTYAPQVTAPQVQKAKKGLRPIRPLAELAPLLAPGTRFWEAPGSSSGVTLFRHDAGDDHLAFVDEVVGNVDHLHGPAMFKVVFWLTGTGPGLTRNKVWWFVFAKDKPAIARAVLEACDGATMVLLAHGEPVTGDGIAKVRELVGAMAG